MAEKSLKATVTKSRIGRPPLQRATLAALGLMRTGQSRVLPDNPSVRGMLDKVSHLVEVEPVSK